MCEKVACCVCHAKGLVTGNRAVSVASRNLSVRTGTVLWIHLSGQVSELIFISHVFIYDQVCGVLKEQVLGYQDDTNVSMMTALCKDVTHVFGINVI
jgi:hypothetical protein